MWDFLFLFDWISVSLSRAVVRCLMLRLLFTRKLHLNSEEPLHKTLVGLQLKRYCCKGSYLTNSIAASLLISITFSRNMGCPNSKDDTRTNAPNNSSVEDEVSSTVTVDSRLPLNGRQVFKLRTSWKCVKRKMEEAGVEMFIR